MGKHAPEPTFDCPRLYEMLMWGATNAQWAEVIEASLDPIGHPIHDDDGKLIPPQHFWRGGDARGAVRSCSYCGSMHPDDFFDAIERGCEIGPTDKNYKVYVDYPDPRAGEQRIVSAITFEPREEERDRWIPVSEKECADLERDGWSVEGKLYVQYTTRDQLHLKMYMHHLNRANADRLRALIEAGKVKIGYPGRFYSGLWLNREVPQ
jgi:hypothetical protein